MRPKWSSATTGWVLYAIAMTATAAMGAYVVWRASEGDFFAHPVASETTMTYAGLILACVLGAYLAALLVIAIAILVTVRKLDRRMAAADDAADDDALLDRHVRRLEREMIKSLRDGRWR
jgi:cbb3-type cytochrome oxidase subunit 1